MNNNTTVSILFVATLVLALVGISAVTQKHSDSANGPSGKAGDQTINDVLGADNTPVRKPELWPNRATSPGRDPIIERKVSELVSQMSLEEKVGQIIQPELKYVTAQDVKDYHLGSILNGGGTTPNNDKHASLADWVDLAEAFYEASMDTSDGAAAIPLIWGTDAVHGNNNVYGATLFPHNIGLGAANDPEMMQRIGAATALEVAATGVNWTFGPTVAVVRDIRWGRTYESYAEDPDIVARYAQAVVKGLQGEGNRAGHYLPNKVVATAKHFLGDGGTLNGVDRGDTIATEWELKTIHGAGYIAALNSNVSTTMASFNSWNGVKLHGHHYLLTDILKGRMGFDGFVVGDWNGHRQVPGCTVTRCPQSINAGLDMFMVPEDWKELYRNTINDVEAGVISQERLDDAVSRILRVKFHAGLFAAGPVKQRPNVGDESLIGNAEHRALAREAVAKSLVLLKNNNGTLPINPSAQILVAGEGADNISMQTGGWTLTWQGTGNTNTDFPGATSVYAGIKETVAAAGGTAHLSADGSWQKSDFLSTGKPDVAIVVFGEQPYAEWHGDIVNIEFQSGTNRDLALLQSLKEQGIPVVSIFLTGRPLWVNKELNASDAFVAAWLPGSEGGGIADVLFTQPNGDVKHDFVGQLSFSWPKYVNQAKLNVGQDDYDPLFAFGYGLDYQSNEVVPNDLSESSARRTQDSLDEMWVFVSRANSPWSIFVQDEGAEAVEVNGNSASSGVDENLQLGSIDKLSQEDARRITWSGLRPATFLLAAEDPQNITEYLKENSVLRFSVSVDRAPQGEVNLALQCVDDVCQNKVELSQHLSQLPLAEWSDLSIDLKCFVEAELSSVAATSVFALSAEQAVSLAIANVKVTPGNLVPEVPASSIHRIQCN